MPLFTLVISCKVRIILVNSVVCEVNKWIIKRFQFIFLCGKSSQAILVNKDPKRLHVGDKYIYSQVEFVSLN